MKKTKIILCCALASCFIAIIAYSGYRIAEIRDDYKKEAEMRRAAMVYKPEPTPDDVNQGVIDLQAEHPDVVGWVTIPNTGIDYPFVRSKDNDYYLRRDLNGDYALAGTVFMDYRCQKDFTSQNTILYGHHMKNGSMFGTLKSFGGKDFFDNNEYGSIYLPRKSLTLAFFAYIVVNSSTEKEIYNAELSDEYFDYVKKNARHYRDIGLTDSDRIVTLSSCAYEFDNARMVLLGKVL